MLPFGHLGVGAGMARAWWKKAPLRPLLLGALLPDLVDKPLYYIPHWLTGRNGAELGLLSGTRSVGHTLLFLLALLLLALVPGRPPRRRHWLAIAAGVATHLFLDNAPELLSELNEHSGRIALLFPYYGWRFPLAYHRTAAEHLFSHLGWYEVGGETLGAFLLWRIWRRSARA